MRRVGSLIAVAIVGLVSVVPTPALGQAITQKDLVGTWRSLGVSWVDWDSTTGKISVRMIERRLTLRPDGVHAAGGRYVTDSGATKNMMTKDYTLWMPKGEAGPWSLAADTLIARSNAADTAPIRWKLSRNGDTLTTAWLAVGDMVPWGWVRIDTTKPLPALEPPPATLKRSDLVGTWVARASMAAAGRSDTVTDTLVLRADSTWAANAKFDKTTVLSGCGLGAAGKSKESSDGTWYIGPANTVVLIDSSHRKVCGAVGHWRGDGPVKLQGQQLIPQNNVSPAYPVYVRTSP